MTDIEILKFVKPYTCVSDERILQVLKSVEYIVNNNTDGDFIEIGVWKGGCVMSICLKLLQIGINDRKIHLYDTFSGMTKPTDLDIDLNGIEAKKWLEKNDCLSYIDEVVENINKTGYPVDNIFYHIGDILDTKKDKIPIKISLLRLDTDWYESTKFELDNFEPNVSKGGIIIIDDYGHWSGSRKATDDFLLGKNIKLNKIDYTGVYWIK